MVQHIHGLCGEAGFGPDARSVELAYHADGKLQQKKWGKAKSLEVLSVLLYADEQR